jgi:hypothetical protein
MGIPIEFCPDLALRDYSEFEKGRRKEPECIPKVLEIGKVYDFLKKGQRLYWFSEDPFWSKGELPLCRTEGNAELGRPIASVKMVEATHLIDNEEVWTKGKYKVIEVFAVDDPKINFEACKRVR